MSGAAPRREPLIIAHLVAAPDDDERSGRARRTAASTRRSASRCTSTPATRGCRAARAMRSSSGTRRLSCLLRRAWPAWSKRAARATADRSNSERTELPRWCFRPERAAFRRRRRGCSFGRSSHRLTVEVPAAGRCSRTAAATARSADASPRGGYSSTPLPVTPTSWPLLGELSSATSGSLTVALRVAASELRGTCLLVPAGTSVSKHRRPRQAPLLVLA